MSVQELTLPNDYDLFADRISVNTLFAELATFESIGVHNVNPKDFGGVLNIGMGGLPSVVNIASPGTPVYIDGVLFTGGSTGTIGPTGPQGIQGPTGAAGTNGTNGSQGATGPQGIQGIAGTNGTNGSQGPTGPQGSVGAIGPTGPSGSPTTATVSASLVGVYSISGTGPAITLNFEKNGNTKTMSWVTTQAAVASPPSPNFITVTAIPPAGFLPTSISSFAYFPITVVNGVTSTTLAAGNIQMFSTGAMNIYVGTSSNFVSSGFAGINSGVITYV